MYFLSHDLKVDDKIAMFLKQKNVFLYVQDKKVIYVVPIITDKGAKVKYVLHDEY